MSWLSAKCLRDFHVQFIHYRFGDCCTIPCSARDDQRFSQWCFKISAKKSITYHLQRFLSFLLLVRGGPLFCVACDSDGTAEGSPHTHTLAVTLIFNTSVVLYCIQKVRKCILRSTTHLEASFYFCYFLWKNFLLKFENFVFFLTQFPWPFIWP